MKRLGALVVAVAMVLGAWWVRERVWDDGGSGGRRSDGSAVRLTCSTELKPVCEHLRSDGVEVAVESPGATADRLSELPDGEDPGLDLWLVDAAWPGIIADNRQFADVAGDVLAEPSEVLARSPVVLLLRRGLRPQLASECGDDVAWSCVGDAAGPQRAVGIAPPDRGGLAVLASAVAGRLATTGYTAAEFEDPAFAGWFDQLVGSTGGRLGGRTPLAVAIVETGRYAAVGALEREVVTLRRSGEAYEPIYPDPVVTSDIVVVPSAGVDGDALEPLGGAEHVRTLLAGAGWRTDDGPPEGAPDSAPALPRSPGLPRAGVLQRLRELWNR